jgi:NADH-quinone oxidoreductase subunit I
MLGTGLLKGLKETARNFIGSYTDETRLVTVQYPEERLPPKEATRQFPFLVYDGADPHAGLRCVACQICEKECPPQCIYIEKSKDKKPDYVGKPQFYPAIFDIDISVCMSCQICVEVCPFEAIKMDTEFELSNTDRFEGLLLRKQQLSRSNEHYHKIHPTEAAEVDARLAAEKAKAQAKAKADAEAKAKAAAAAGKPPAPTTPPAPKVDSVPKAPAPTPAKV